MRAGMVASCYVIVAAVLGVWLPGRAYGLVNQGEETTFCRQTAALVPRPAGHNIRRVGRPREVRRLLEKKVDLSPLGLQTPFEEAIEVLEESAGGRLEIVVLWRDLQDNAFVEPDTPILMKGVRGIRLRTGLKLLLLAVSSGGAKLDYVVAGGVIVIGTEGNLPRRELVKLYGVEDLTGPPARFGYNPAIGLEGGPSRWSDRGSTGRTRSGDDVTGYGRRR